jgi:hypothetical protein
LLGVKRTVFFVIVALLAGCSSAPPAPLTVPAPAPQPTVLPKQTMPPAPAFSPVEGATVTVPDWGPSARSKCVAGRVKLEVQQFVPDNGRMVVNLMNVLPVDFDGDGIDEYAVYLMCGEGPESGGRQVVGFRRTTKGFVPMGRIIGTQDGMQMMELMEIRGRRVAILVSNQYSDGGTQRAPSQWRVYAWTGTRFRHVDGPTSFPANPPSVRLAVARAELTLAPVTDAVAGTLPITVTNKGNLATGTAQIFLRLPPELLPTGDKWTGCTHDQESYFTCPIGPIPAGGTQTVRLDLLAPADFRPRSGSWSVSVMTTAADVYDTSTETEAPVEILVRGVAPS